MALNGNGTSQYLQIGTALTVSRSIPMTIAALVDSTSLRTSGNWNGVIGQGDQNVSGGLSWELEISGTATPALDFAASQATGASTWGATQDCSGGPSIAANTGWWLVGCALRHVTNTLACAYFAYRYNTGTLTQANGGTITFASAATQFAPPSAGSLTNVGAICDTNAAVDIYPGAVAWAGVWNADLTNAGATNPPAIWELISRGPLAMADSTLAGLWILESNDGQDYSTGAHPGTYQGSPSFVGVPVNYWPLFTVARNTQFASGGTPVNLAASGGIVYGGTSTLTPQALTTTGGATFGSGTATLSVQGTFAATGGIIVAGTANLTQTNALAASGGMAFGGTAALSTSATLSASGGVVFGGVVISAGGSNFEIGNKAGSTGANDIPQSIVRDSSGVLWRAAFTAADFTNGSGQNNNNQLRMYKCNAAGVPASFTEQDSAHHPTNVGSHSIAIDANDVIHVAYVHCYVAGTTGIFYNTFDTGSNLWGTEVQIGIVNYTSSAVYTVGDAGVTIDLDANGKPHVVSYGQSSGTGATHIWYTNKTSGSWSTALQLDTASLSTNQRCMHPSCMFDSTGALHVVWMTITFNYDQNAQHCFYIKRSAGGSFGSVQQFSEQLLGSIDNSPAVYVDEDDHVHVAYLLGDGNNPVGETVTGTTVNNKLFYRFSADGGSTWNTTTQTAHFITHCPGLGPDGFGGVRIWCHGEPPTVDGDNGAQGYFRLARGSSTWDAWTQKMVDANGDGYDSSPSPRRATFNNRWRSYLDMAYFDLNTPLSAMIASEPNGNALVASRPTGGATFAGTSTLTPQALAVTGGAIFGGSATLTASAVLSVTGGAIFGGTDTLTPQSLTTTGGITFGGTSTITPAAWSASGGVTFGGNATLSSIGSGFNAGGGITFSGTAALTTTTALAATGGALFGGAATVTPQQIAANGGMVLGGGAALTATVPLIATGGAVFGGAGTLTSAQGWAAAGGITFGGSGALTITRLLAATGGITFGGSATSGSVSHLYGTVELSDAAVATLTMSDSRPGG